MCMLWVSCSYQWMTMEGSFGSGCRNSENSRALSTSGASERNLRRVIASTRTALSGEGSQNSGSRRGKEWYVSLRGDHHKQLAGSLEVCSDEVVANPYVPNMEWGDVNLRQWLDQPDRSVDVFECLHIFRQIVEIVHVAHSQGIVVHNVRPSCFVMSSFNHVSFIESASNSDSGSETFEDALNNQTVENINPLSLASSQNMLQHRIAGGEDLVLVKTPTASAETNCTLSKLYTAHASLVEEQIEENKSRNRRRTEDVGSNKPPFPMKQILLTETNWYTSPEEVAGAPSPCASDIYRLGVLLFEIFCPLKTREEKSATMSSLIHRVLPPQLLLKWPKEAAFCLWLLHPEPSSRPTLGDLLQSEFLNEQKDDLQEREAALDLQERIEEQELLLEFLFLIQQRKQEVADKLERTVSFLYSDIEEVTKQQLILKETATTSSEQGTDDHSASTFQLMTSVDGDDSACLSTRKRVRPGVCIYNINESNDSQFDDEKIGDTTFHRNSRLVKDFKKLESAYFLTRCRPGNPLGSTVVKHLPAIVDGGGTIVSERTSVNYFSSNRWIGDNKSGWINPFLKGFCKYLSFSKLNVKADLKQADLLNSSNLVCSVGFDRDGEFFATAGVNKKIKVFECKATISENHDVHYPVGEMACRSKLSSICWNTYIKSQIASSNFEGAVQVWDATRSQVISQMTEHERRVWSVDFSTVDPTLLASGSDDFSVKLWSINQAESAGTIKTKANVCCVKFAPESCRFIAFGSADHKIYYYDLRNSKMPLYTLVGHSKTVGYVKFVDPMNLVSSSTDNSLKLWDLSMSESRVIDTPVQSFSGHLNVKVFVYYKAFPMPALSFRFQNTDPISGLNVDDPTQFISSVCWSGQSSTLIAANSKGNVKILEMV